MGLLYSDSASSFGGTPVFDGYFVFLSKGDDEFFSLPEEVQEQVNIHADQFRSETEIRNFIHDIMRRG